MTQNDHGGMLCAEEDGVSRGQSLSEQRKRLTGQRGFAMIDVMIGALIFLAGVMAIAALHTQAIRVNHDGLQRSQALWLVYDIAERVTLNAGETNNYQAQFLTAANDITYCDTEPQQPCLNRTCTAEQMATFDVFDIMCQSGTLGNMVNPTVSITCSTENCIAGDRVEILVSWDERGGVGGGGQGEVSHEYTQR